MSTIHTCIILVAGGCALCADVALATDTKDGAGTPRALAATTTDAPHFAVRNPRYQIRPGDGVEIRVAPATEFNQTATVQPDGYLSLREVGDIHVQGKTLPELREAVSSSYRTILADAVISVVLTDFEKPHFTVGGQVARPGKYELRADTTLMESVAIAGGLSDRAKQRQVLLFRRVSDDWVEVKALDLKAALKGRLQEDVHLRPGDLVFVPQNKMSHLKPFLPIWSLGTYLGVTPRF